MATAVPKNVAAALGLVPTVLGGVRRLPTKAVQLPVMAVGSALSGIDAARREYDELADRGERLIARLRGTSFDEVEDKVEDRLSGTPVAKLYDRAEDALERVFETSKDNAKQAVKADTAAAQDRAEANAAVQQTLPVEQPPAASSNGRVDSAATPDVVEQVEKIASNVDAPLVTNAADLPLPDYDHMTLGALRGRLRSLDMQQLVQLRDYEKSKAHRLPVVTMLDNRIAKLANGESTPTGSTPDTPSPKASTATKPPKSLDATAEAKNSPSPPHGKVRLT
ncbi:MAG: hypothetical protein QOJ79_2544 [Actinomycetota bacterium]|jgi:hypothetical protein|nr:hypothetical protein [Actinomycetota bacterium]